MLAALPLYTHYDEHGTFALGRMALFGEVRESYKEGKFRTIALVVKSRNLTILENLQAHVPTSSSRKPNPQHFVLTCGESIFS